MELLVFNDRSDLTTQSQGHRTVEEFFYYKTFLTDARRTIH